MQLKNFHVEIHAEVEFTREELDQFIKLSEQHYDGLCQAASKPGPHGLLNGYKVLLGDSKTVTVTASWRDLDLLCKIAEAENGFQMIGGMPVPGELGVKILSIMQKMRHHQQAVGRMHRPNPTP